MDQPVEINTSRESITTDLSEEEGIVYQFINDRALHLDEIIKESGLQSSGVTRVLLGLELKNLIRQLPGKFFRRK